MAKSEPASKTPPSLTAQSPLGGYNAAVNGTSLLEVTRLSMVSVAPLAGSQTAFQTAIAKLFKTGKTDSPKPSATVALDGSGKRLCILMPTAQNQWFLCFDDDDANPVDAAKALLGKSLSKQIAMANTFLSESFPLRLVVLPNHGHDYPYCFEEEINNSIDFILNE